MVAGQQIAGQRHQRQHSRSVTAAACVILLLAWSNTAAAVLLSQRPGNVLTMILTDCAKYQDWQTVAAAFAWRQSGQPGSVVRVANCNEKDTKNYDPHMLDYVATHMAKQYAWYEPLKDWYAAYNKPGAVVDYFEHTTPKEEWIVILDSDMLLKTPFIPEDLPLERGWAYAAHYDYLVGVNNDLALRHVPEVAPRNDTIAGPLGRRGDRVGGPYYMHRDDLSRLAPQWLNYTHIMRNDTVAYKDSGDTASKMGDRIWIAEMYGYSFGAAKTNVWHKWHHDFMLYPSYTPSYIPHVMHYGLIYRVGDWQYDKHWYFDFDVHKCPPWEGLDGKPKAGIFPPPPHPDKLPKKDYLTHYRDLLSVSVISVVNAAMCDYHVRNCPPSPQLTAVCDEAFKLYHAIDSELKDYEWRWNCTDHNKQCKPWADRGECKNSKQYMMDHCRESCKYCTAPGPRPKDAVELHPLSVASISAEIGVTPAPAGTGAAATPAAAAHAESKQAATEADKAAGEKAAADNAAAGKAADKGMTAEDAAVAAKLAALQSAVVKSVADRAADDEKAAKDKAEGELAAAKKAEAEIAAADKAAAHKAEAGASESDMSGKYPTSTLSYAALVKRCTELQGLDDAALKVCIRAAGFKLLYPGTLSTAADGSNAAAQQLTDGLQAGSSSSSTGSALDLHSLHNKFQGGRDKVQDMLNRSVVNEGSWSFAEQSMVVLVVLGVGVAGYSRYAKYRANKAKNHRSE